MVIGVIVDIKNRQVNREFDYHVTSSLESFIQVGERVFIPFGSQRLIGFIVGIKEDTDRKLKDIIELIDYEPVLSSELIELGKQMGEHYFSFLIDIYLQMVPQALKTKYPKMVKFINKDNISLLLRDKLNERDEVSLDELSDFKDELSKLKNKKDIIIYNLFKENSKPKTEKYIKLLDSEKAKTLKQKEIVNFLKETKSELKLKYLISDMEYSKGVIDTLYKNGAVDIYELEQYREIEFMASDYEKKVLNSYQKNAYEEITKDEGFSEYLIHGVCGSGKTEVYLALIEYYLSLSKQAIMLVPEISLTPQIVSRFKARFGDKVAIFHSRLSNGERFDEWRRIRRKEASIVVGARSALFVPMDNIGIIIMDEEQESSYIQDSNPKYSAHFVAKKRAMYHNAKLVYGSATPSVKTYYNALNSNIKLLEIPQRANGQKPLNATVVDMREELKSGNRSVLSRSLKEELKKTLSRGEQAILLINRRGYSTFVMCRSCGEEIKCPHCDVTLTYHKYNNSLVCHYCGYQTPSPTRCPKCDSSYIRFVGDGTQKVEEELNKTFKEAKVLRMDSDTTKNKNGHEDIIESFLNHDADILLGTQVVAKGLDFPLVSLVGIVNADLGLKMPFYDAYEKTYNLIEQASGRAGRKDTLGKVIIQTYDPSNSVIKFAKEHNYKGFYLDELERRKLANTPPFMSLIEIIVSSDKEDKAFKEALNVTNMIKNQNQNAYVLGPVKYYIFKIKDRYNYLITLKLNYDDEFKTLNYLNTYEQGLKDVYISITRM